MQVASYMMQPPHGRSLVLNATAQEGNMHAGESRWLPKINKGYWWAIWLFWYVVVPNNCLYFIGLRIAKTSLLPLHEMYKLINWMIKSMLNCSWLVIIGLEFVDVIMPCKCNIINHKSLMNRFCCIAMTWGPYTVQAGKEMGYLCSAVQLSRSNAWASLNNCIQMASASYQRSKWF